MRLSDARLRRHQTKLIYPDHRLPPWLIEDAPRDRSNRLLGTPLHLQKGLFRIDLNIQQSLIGVENKSKADSRLETPPRRSSFLDTEYTWATLRLVCGGRASCPVRAVGT